MEIIKIILLRFFSYIGFAEAKNMLGIRYQQGNGVLQNFNESIRLFESASEYSRCAKFNLGRMYEQGKGIVRDINKAMVLYELAANEGHLWAQTHLGDIYMNGDDGVAVNYDKAIKWYKQAAKKGFVPAKYNLGRAYYFGHGVDQNYFEAIKLYEAAIEAPCAKYNLGLMYADGIGVDIDYEKAYVLLRDAYESGFVEAKDSLEIVKNKLGAKPA